MKLKIEQIGDEAGGILSEELVARLNLDQGATLLEAEVAEGGLHLMPWHPASAQPTPGGEPGTRS